jgi:hypothetical protein
VSRGSDKTRIEELRRALAQTDSTAFLVESRVIRRVIRERFNFARLTAAIPHPESQVVPVVDVRYLVHPDELGLQTFDKLPDICLLLSLPEDNELEHWPLPELLLQVWRRLFHARLDRHLLTLPSIRRADVQERIAAIGQVEFDEAHFVLRSEHRLIDPESRMEAWREFVATYSELLLFEPDLLSVWFPSLAGRDVVSTVNARDVDVHALFQQTRLPGAPDPDLTPHAERDEERLVRTRRDWSVGLGTSPSDRAWLRHLRRREKANERGNTVAAVVHAIRAVQRATSDDKRDSAQQKAREDIRTLVLRLRRALAFPADDDAAWHASLWELATNSVHGFWNSEKRLLFDLQKVCLDHERVSYRVDLVKWLVARGRRPLRRPLTSLREVMMAKHLASSAARLVDVRLSGTERERLSQLLHDAADRAEAQMRQRVRPLLNSTLDEVGVRAANLPERVALDKLVEDALDCIADRGYLTMGYLRDAISRNDLKVPDLQEFAELYRGDQLLRADDRLDVKLDGVYRRGDFYLRWLQVVSAIFFGTRAGRFATLFLIIPFGGATVIVEGVRHTAGLFHRKEPAGKTSDSRPDTKTRTPPDPARALEGGQDPGAGDATAKITEDPGRSPTDTDLTNSESGVSGQPVGTNALTNASGGNSDPGSPRSDGDNTAEIILVPPGPDEAFDQVIARRVESWSWVVVVGFLLMALIHITAFRRRFFKLLSNGMRLFRKVFITLPQKLLKLPLVQKFWRHRTFVQFRRLVLIPGLIALVLVRWLPQLLTGDPPGNWWVLTIAVLTSMAWNSRLGQDTQELTAEWVGNAWYKLRARVVMAVLDWVIDLFRTILNFIERFLYAVDEWLRFHSEESWLSIVTKACLGIVWSAVSFLLRIYINLLIEPTLHPVKHFPVVTVAHKMFLPLITVFGEWMLKLFTPYMGFALASLFTGFNIFFLPGIFGFLVWELKENWRLYQANRKPHLTPVAVGSHGETIARLLRPGFHSGTLPKLFRKLRRLEHHPASFHRFSARRARRLQLEHVEQAVRSFVERELIQLLTLSPAWSGIAMTCGAIQAASNSFSVELCCPSLGDTPLRLLFQEQSGWVVASVPVTGWLPEASPAQVLSLKNALEGFYRKADMDLVREQVEARFLGTHEYDINSEGFVIWPNGMFSHELSVDLSRPGSLRPLPVDDAQAVGLGPIDRRRVVFGDSDTAWNDWVALWSPEAATATGAESGDPARIAGPPVSIHDLPPACREEPQVPVLKIPPA